jgi:peroxiredoxin Q/BCP
MPSPLAPGPRSTPRSHAIAALCLLILATAAGGARAQLPLLQPGTQFPNWTLVDHTGAKVSSKDLAGKRYLMWFFSANTIGATTLGDALRDRAERFKAKGVEILGVSFSPPKDNAAMVEKEHLPFRLLSDVDRDLGIQIGVADRRKAPAPRRCTYVVSAEAKVERVYCEVNFLTHADDVLADLQ